MAQEKVDIERMVEISRLGGESSAFLRAMSILERSQDIQGAKIKLIEEIEKILKELLVLLKCTAPPEAS